MALTEEQRQENAKAMNAYMSTVAGIGASYFTGYIGSCMADYRAGIVEGISQMVENFQLQEFLYPINTGAVGGWLIGAGLGLLTYFWLKNDYERHKSYKHDEIAGTGGFMNAIDKKEWNEKFVDKVPSNNMIYAEHFYRSINDRMTQLNNNLLVIGGAGTGKSRFVIKPNILQFNASYVVTDPSGEMITTLGKALKDHGYIIKIFNISDMTHSNCYNPVNYIRDEAGVNMLIDCFIKNTTGKGNKGDEFFTNAEKLLYSACLFYLLDFCNDQSRKNMASVLNMVNSSAVDENDASAKSPLDILFDRLPQNSLAWKYYKAFKQAAGKTLKSIIISCVTRLQPFMTPQVVNLTKTDDLELDKIGDRKTALFIITPQADRTYSFLASMLYSQLFETLYHKGEQQKASGKSERLNVHVRCLMDEFANIGEVPEFPSKLSTMRKYNISATIILQDKSQIEAMYKDEWKTLVANCDNILYLGSSENETLKYFSEKLGEMTITVKSRGMSKGSSNQNYQQQKREVMTAEEVGRLPNNECLIFTRARRPVRDEKYHYENHPNYKYAAEGDKEEEYAFRYNQMPVFDNTTPKNINSLLKAKAEVARFKRSREVQDVQDAKDIAASKNTNEELNKLQGTETMETMSFNGALMTGLDQIASSIGDAVSFVTLDHFPSRLLDGVLRQLANQTGKYPILLISNIDASDNQVAICGIDKSSQLRDLLNASIYVREVEIKNDLLYFYVKQSALDNFKDEIAVNYKPYEDTGMKNPSNMKQATPQPHSFSVADFDDEFSDESDDENASINKDENVIETDADLEELEEDEEFEFE